MILLLKDLEIEIIKMHYFEEMTFSDIAKQLNYKSKTHMSEVHSAALKKLKILLKNKS